MPQGVNIYEIVGVIFGFISVYFAAKDNIWCWPTGIISVVVYAVFYYQVTMYASMYLQFFFLVFCIHGWYEWLYGGDNKTGLKITKITVFHGVILFIIFVLLTLLFGYIFDHYSNDQIPYADALITAMSIVAQWMLNKKIVENWLVWILVDVVYAIVHVHMTNYPSAFLYTGYLFFASLGYILWLKTFRKQTV